jgi:hypothetical protein
LIYFDALDTEFSLNYGVPLFLKNVSSPETQGILVTYAARRSKRSMIEVGFTVEKLAGPPGKEKCFVL